MSTTFIKSYAWLMTTQKRKINFMAPFLWMGFNCINATATSRRQFTFYHSVPRNYWYSFYRLRKNERLRYHLQYLLLLSSSICIRFSALKLSPRMSFWKKICLTKKNWKNITLGPRSWNYCKHYKPNQSKFNDVNSKNTFCSSLYDSTRKFKHIILNNTTCKVFQHHPLPCKVLR